MHLRILLAVVVAMASLGPVSAQEGPNCESSCGNVNITFPFGSGEGCYYNPSFFVTCNRSSHEHIAFLGKGNVVISNMSTNTSEMEIMKLVSHDCYNSSGSTKRNRPFMTLRDFRISTKNKFVAIGCDTSAYIRGTIGNESYGTGCISRCNSSSHITNESCSGAGCCEIAIPKGMSSFNISVRSYNNHKNILDFNPCSHGFVIEDGKYNFSSTDLLDFGKERMPMLLDWAIGNVTCDIASKDTDKFLCKGKSGCDQNYGGPGYRCRCDEGYDGNPYIANNCTNINECEHTNHGCQHECIDEVGSYRCSCPKGYSGDGKKDGTGCIADESHIIQIVVGTSVAIIFLFILVTWLYWGLKKRKFMMLREKFFRQNGGIMLQQRISRWLFS